MSELPEYLIDRVFNAPREMVWRAWTDPELLHQVVRPRRRNHHTQIRPQTGWIVTQSDAMGRQQRLQHNGFSGSRPAGEVSLASFLVGRGLEHHLQPDDTGLAPDTPDNCDIRGHGRQNKCTPDPGTPRSN